MKTGIDLDHAHPTCSPSATTTANCLPWPINGDLLQVMPWPVFQSMTDRQLIAIYTYLKNDPLSGRRSERASRLLVTETLATKAASCSAHAAHPA